MNGWWGIVYIIVLYYAVWGIIGLLFILSYWAEEQS